MGFPPLLATARSKPSPFGKLPKPGRPHKPSPFGNFRNLDLVFFMILAIFNRGLWLLDAIPTASDSYCGVPGKRNFLLARPKKS
jgi:hypothetical protein